MASGPKRNGIAKMRNLIAQRAGAVLDRCYPGPHRDKLIARDFGLSVRMVQHLRAGEHWTLDRLAQASAPIGAAFDAALYIPATDAQHISEMDEIAGRLARLEARVDGEVDIRNAARLAPRPSAEAGAQSGTTGAERRVGFGRRATDRPREAAQGESAPLARSVQRREVKR